VSVADQGKGVPGEVRPADECQLDQAFPRALRAERVEQGGRDQAIAGIEREALRSRGLQPRGSGVNRLHHGLLGVEIEDLDRRGWRDQVEGHAGFLFVARIWH
jgi:hypothetical protein